MAEVKEITIPLRAAWNVPRTYRAKRAMAEIKIHVSRHMKKTEDENGNLGIRTDSYDALESSHVLKSLICNRQPNNGIDGVCIDA